MDSVVAAHLLEQVDAIGSQTRALMRSLWYPFVVWGALAGGQVAMSGPDATVPVELFGSAVLMATGAILRSQEQAATRGTALSLAG
jgi:hypothetical protein